MAAANGFCWSSRSRYLPEPGSRYEWSTVRSSSLLQVSKVGGNGGDPWSNATGVLRSSTLTLSFHFPANLGGRTIIKNGTVASDCSEVVMHDSRPGCVYRRCSSGACLAPPAPAPAPPTPVPREQMLPWLRTKASELLGQATVPTTVIGGPSLLQPGISATYQGQWMRDGYYGIANGWSALRNHTEARLGVEFLFSRTRRTDGALPQMVSLSGDPSWVMWGNCTCQPNCPGDAGPFQCPWEAVLNGSDASYGCCTGQLVVMDSAPFGVLTVAHFVSKLPESKGGGLPFFTRHFAAIDAAMDTGVPLSPSGLPEADPKYSPARVGYGFADALGKSGDDLYMSVLFWDACNQLAGLHGQAAAVVPPGAERSKHLDSAAVREQETPALLIAENLTQSSYCPSVSRVVFFVSASSFLSMTLFVSLAPQHFKSRADSVRANISSLWDDSVGAFRAASVKRRESVDVWGSVYAGPTDFPFASV